MKNGFYWAIISVGLCLGFVQQGISQQNALYFNHLGIKQGLSQSIVYCAHQDREGFMWFGTANGLNKYDGYGFEVFQPDPNDPDHSLRNNIIWDILEDKKNRMWVATLGEGIHEVDKKTGRATAHKTAVSTRDLCYQICLDHQGAIWIASAAGLNQFNPDTKKFVLWPAPAPGDQEIRSVLEDNHGLLWVGTTKGLYHLNRQTRRFTAVQLDPAQPHRHDFINALYQDSSGTVWAVSIEKGLYRFDYNQFQRAYRVNPHVYLANMGVSPNGIAEQSPGLLWVGTHGKGLRQINTRTGEVTAYVQQKDVAGSLSNNSVLAVLQIKTGTLWVGTDNGINVSSPLARKFQVFQLATDPTFSRLIDNHISALYEDREGIIWIGNEWYVHADGLFRLDRRTGNRRLYQHQPGLASSLLSNRVTAVLEDRKGILWVGTLDGVQSMERKTGKFTRYPTRIKVLSIQEDRRGNLWLGGKEGLARLDRQTGQLSYHWHNYNNNVNKLFTSRTGHIWVATAGQGLGRINPDSVRYIPVQVGNGKPLSRTTGRLSDWNILSIYEDRQGIVWLGTSQGGLNRFDPHTNTCQIITTRQGLPSNNIVGILGDESGHLWLSTNRGICRYNPKNGYCRTYDQRDGLQDNEFHLAYAKGTDGALLFGGPNGFNVFYPDQLRDNPVPPTVYITSLQVSEENWPLPKKELELAYNDNFLQLGFVGLNYVLPEKNQYAYQLEGLDKGWVYNGTRRLARYTDLSPGTYVFRVKAANNDGVWSIHNPALTIIIHPPWWRTWWAYLLYALAAIAAIWAFVGVRSRALRRENQRLEQHVAQRTQQVLEQSEEIKAQRDNLAQTLGHLEATQTQLIQSEKMASLGELTAGIAHEIQNPLNFVNNFSEVSTDLLDELKEGPLAHLPEGDKAYAHELITDLTQNLQRISRHGLRASSIVKGMLEHSRSRGGDKQPIDVNKLVEEALRLAYHGMRAKGSTGLRDASPSDLPEPLAFNCTLVTQFDPTLGSLSVVSQDMSRVLLNLFNNAFYAVRERATRDRASTEPYQPTVTVSTRQANGSVEVRISDNGIGMPEEVQQKIFQPFFTTKPPGQGTGLGLSLAYDIVVKGHQGQISVRSQEGQGTEFVVCIPV